MRILSNHSWTQHERRITLEDAPRIELGAWAEGEYVNPLYIVASWRDDATDVVVAVSGRVHNAKGTSMLRNYEFYFYSSPTDKSNPPPQWVLDLLPELPEFHQSTDASEVKL